MKLQEYELVDRYLYYLCRYLPYDEQEHATEDFLRLLEERLPTFYTQDDIQTQVQRMGHPYAFAMKYSTKGNIFLSGKHYELFIIFLRLLAISALLGLGFFFFNYFVRLQRLNIVDLVSHLLLTTIGVCLLAAWVTEKVKTTKVLTSLMGTWSTEQLYPHKSIGMGPLSMLYVLAYGTLFFTLLLYIKTGDYSHLLQVIVVGFFFLHVLRDLLSAAEASYHGAVTGFGYVVDIMTILGFWVMMQASIPRLAMIEGLMMLSAIHLGKITYELLLEKHLLSFSIISRNKKRKRRDSRNRTGEDKHARKSIRKEGKKDFSKKETEIFQRRKIGTEKKKFFLWEKYIPLKKKSKEKEEVKTETMERGKKES